MARKRRARTTPVVVNTSFEQFLYRWRNSRLSPLRFAIVVLVTIVLAVSLATPLRTYYQQQSQKDMLIAQNEQLRKDIKHKQEQLAIQNDPAAIQEQARQRLLLVPRGETPFRVYAPDKDSSSELQKQVNKQQTLVMSGDGPWYKDLWHSVSVPVADNIPSTSAPANSEAPQNGSTQRTSTAPPPLRVPILPSQQ